jgi:hypothetical protein
LCSGILISIYHIFFPLKKNKNKAFVFDFFTIHLISGVYSITMDGDEGTVKVSGRVNPNTLLSVLETNGKHAKVKYVKFEGEVVERNPNYYGKYDYYPYDNGMEYYSYPPRLPFPPPQVYHPSQPPSFRPPPIPYPNPPPMPSGSFWAQPQHQQPPPPPMYGNGPPPPTSFCPPQRQPPPPPPPMKGNGPPASTSFSLPQHLPKEETSSKKKKSRKLCVIM